MTIISKPKALTTTDIPARFAEAQTADAGLYWYARLADSHYSNGVLSRGKGFVSISISEAAACLGRSKATIKRYAKNLELQGFFRSLSIQGDSISIFYASLLSLMRAQGMHRESVWLRASAEDLGRLSLRLTEAVATHLQRSSRYQMVLEQRAKQEAHRPSLPTLESIVEPPINPLGAMDKISGGISRNGFVFIPEGFASWGGSQGTMAKYLGVSRETICNRLSHEVRRAAKLEPITRVQLAKEAGLSTGELELLRSESCGELDTGNTQFFTGPNSKVYHYLPCLYMFTGVELTTKTRLRRKLKVGS